MATAAVVVLGAVFACAIFAFARRLGVAYLVPVAIATLVALDWYSIPPTHETSVPNLANALTIGAYLLVAVLVGQVACTGVAPADASETARGVLADEQSALRRVATLVAHGPEPSVVYAAVAAEIGSLLDADAVTVDRLEADGTTTVVAAWPAADRVDQLQTRAVVRAPIVVDERTWGTASAYAQPERWLPADSERRIAEFAELVAMAISNAESRAELAASRTRVVTAADGARRRLERDLHDGVQQQLVALVLTVRSAAGLVPPGHDELHRILSHVDEGLAGSLEELRTISRGIHPAILSQGGLRLALKALARRSPVAVDLDVSYDGRFPECVEVTAYYVASEVLTNVAKHAQASTVALRVEVIERKLTLSIRDDGVGGADPAGGSGLVGLMDRVAAVHGTISVVSPPGGGTEVLVALPLADVAQKTSDVAGSRPSTPTLGA